MSILFAAVIGLGQLCYNADHDIGSGEIMRGAVTFEQLLGKAMKNRESTCWSIHSEAQLAEAKKLVLMDATGKTLTIK